MKYLPGSFGNLFTAFLMLVLFACNNKNNASEPHYSFYYYPGQNLYYNVSSSNYVYSLNGGKSWDSTRLNPGSEPVIAGRKVVLSSNSPDIWKENAVHRQAYNGVLLNFDAPQISVDPLADVSEKKIQKPVQVDNGDKKPRKRNFFDKLFGRKKKAE